jgi:hydrogenase nickel incorporation protein HypB
MPEKYPVMFHAADLMVVTKLDVLDAVGDFKPERATRHLRDIASVAPVLELSSGSGRGTEAWLGWLGEAVAHGRDRRDVAIDQGRHAAESTAHG